MTFLKEHSVSDDEAGIRLDRWFKRHFPHLSHGQLQKMLRTGQIRVAGKRTEAAMRLEAGQAIRVPPQAMAMPEKAIKKRAERETDQLKRMIIYEDDDVIALNKPAGLAVQGGTGLKENLDDMLAGLAGKGGKPKLVHRLDRDTSGVLLVARNAFAATKLTQAFRHRDTRKVYWALTHGVPKPLSGRIEAPVYKEGEVMRVAEGEYADAKNAITLYQTLENVTGQAALVALWPVTGRTHQLRVHMTYIGHPIIGDRIYKTDKATTLPLDELGQGLHLHARRLIIPHPRRGMIDVTAPLGPAMRKSWKWFDFDESADADFSDT